MRSIVRIFGLVLAAAFATQPLQARAEPTRTLFPGFGATFVDLSDEFFGLSQSLGLKIIPLRGSLMRNGQVRFPIISGDVDIGTAKTEITHGGGLRLYNGSTVADLKDFIIDSTSATGPVITARVVINENYLGRIPVFDLVLPFLPLPLKARPYSRFVIPNIGLNLSATAAVTLNGALQTKAFAAGAQIGNGTIYSFIAEG